MRFQTMRIVQASLTALSFIALAPGRGHGAAETIAPGRFARIGAVDERFQSYNVEMAEVIGGWFWKPYAGTGSAARDRPASARRPGIPAGMDPSLYEWRAPVDLSNPRLRKAAAALGPTYVRVSGTWANTVWFHDSDDSAPESPPAGYGGVLTRSEWRGVVDFSRAVGAKIVTSFATGVGPRGPDGTWTPDQARRLLAYTSSIGGAIAAAEFMNEPNAAAMGGAPEGYDARAYGGDVAVFRHFVKQTAPEMLVLGPGSVGEGGTVLMTMGPGMLRSDDLLRAAGSAFDVFSYHLYAAVSERCASMGAALQTTPDAALSEEWLARVDSIDGFYRALRDRFEPGKAMWITETADTACGGNPWASTFLDSFRYVDSHGRLARRGVQVIMHNTLASSDYGLLDSGTLAPRPNYWAALLWARLMGPTVLDPGPSPHGTVHLYAHCLAGHAGGVAIVAINLDRTASHDLAIAATTSRYTLTAQRLRDHVVQLDGKDLRTGPDGEIPELRGVATAAGSISLPPASITFLAVADAANAACR